jgi:predicted MFS family arabinose efflux permease
LFGLAALIVLAWILPGDSHRKGSRPDMWLNFRTVLTCPPALSGLAVGCLLSAANEVVNLVFGVWMEDTFGLKIAALGAASAVIGLSELSGESLVGVLVDRLGKPRAVGIGILLNCAAALALPFFGRTVLGALIGLFLFYITFEFTLVSAIPLMTEILPPARATLMALNVAGHSTGRALGSLLAPPVYTFGILASAGAALLLNLLGMFALYTLIRGIRNRGDGEVI